MNLIACDGGPCNDRWVDADRMGGRWPAAIACGPREILYGFYVRDGNRYRWDSTTLKTIHLEK